MHHQFKTIYLISDYCFDSILNPFNEFSGIINVMTSGIIQVYLFIPFTDMLYGIINVMTSGIIQVYLFIHFTDMLYLIIETHLL